eukprot:GGOE01002883.1.p1 GENE.GGOE01002883.1~~GGOE01002883.1.p1  ORF type:complete len:587 (+),score=140.90 GGOE01002883.1:90-1850(+)
MDVLKAKFGPYFTPFISYVESSGVALEDLDYDTEWDNLLAEVVWPASCCPNAAQRSAMKKALRAFCQPPNTNAASWAAPLSLKKGKANAAFTSEQVLARADSIKTWPLAGAYARNFSRSMEGPSRKAGGGAAGQKAAPRPVGNQHEEDRSAALAKELLVESVEATEGLAAKISKCSQATKHSAAADVVLMANGQCQSSMGECSRKQRSLLDAVAVGSSVVHQTVQVAAQGGSEALLQPALKVTTNTGRILSSSSPGDPLLDELADALLEDEQKDSKAKIVKTTPPTEARQVISFEFSSTKLNRAVPVNAASVIAATSVVSPFDWAPPEEPAPTFAAQDPPVSEQVKIPATEIKVSRTKLRKSKAAKMTVKAVDPEQQRIDRAIAEEFLAFKAKLKKNGAGPKPSKSAPFLPNYKSTPPPKPKKSLQQQNAELLDFCGVDQGTIMQHWMLLWKERGRPNRGAELSIFQEETLKFLEQHRNGKKVEDSWALQNIIKSYANAKSELLRNMMADETAAKVDADGDDALNMDEFRKLYEDTHPGQPIADEMIKAAWTFADKDGSGEVDFAEMMLWLDKVAYEETGVYVPEK